MPQLHSTSLLFGLVLLTILQAPGVQNGFACLSNPCIHGVCLDDLNSTYFCYCIDGFTGLQCQTNWNDCWSSPCQNGGVCVDGIASFNCTCPPGFVGDLCEEDFNECESNPCWNNGTCVDGPNGYNCNCLPGYSGIHCEIDIAVCNITGEARCQNGGVCEEGPGDTFSCRCQPGWESFLCDIETDECLSAPCQNGAVCIDLHANYECACLFGYTGRNCEEVIKICDKNPCKNAALCLIEDNLPVCYCVPDFHGELCQLQYDECLLGPKCLNGGTCIDGIDNFTCSCPSMLTGVFCECLKLPDKQLDCNYILPNFTSTEYYQNVTETESTISSFFTSETTITQVPTQSTESTTVPYCITQTPTTKLTKSPTSTSTILSTTTIETEMSISTEFTPLMTEPISTTTFETTSSFTETSTNLITSGRESRTDNVTTETTSEIATIEISSVYPKSTSTVSTTEETKVYSTQPITLETTLTSTLPSTTTFTQFTTITSEMIDFTTPPNTTVMTTSERITTETIASTTEMVKETVPTVLPATTLFFTEEPTTTQTILSASSESTTETIPLTTLGVDCTLPEKKCENGGTCIFTEEGYQCLCPFDTEGSYCQTKLGIKNAAFNGNSYLTHRLSKNKNISLDFEAKTLSSAGLIFLLYLDKNYMALYVENGFLMFKFSCGYQTMLLSELTLPVNNGFMMRIKADLEFSKDLKHCDASIKVNDSLSMAGDQIANKDMLSKRPAWLHLGGIPNSIFNDNLPSGGFIGCMSSLRISGKYIYIYKDADDGYEISECSSLICLSNPCKNGASCSSIGENWICHCRNGFLGKMCEISICDDNPCLFGGTCIPFSNSGYICLCPYGKHGHFCENDLKITEPNFSSTVRGLSSFVAYPLPEGISQKMEIKFRFTPTTMEQISLLLFIGQNGQHDFYSDHLAVSFIKGYIMLTWNMGSGPRRIFTTKPIESGARDYLVQLGYDSRRAWLFVDNLGNVTGRSPGNAVQLDIMPFLYLGGHDSKNFSTLPHDLPLHTGFSGCIFDVEIKIGSIVLPLQGSLKAIGRAVGQCGTTECYEKSCQNDGACLHHGSTFMCLCQDKWYGPLCSSKTNFCDVNFTTCAAGSRCVPLLTNYECDCPFGMVGKDCEKGENITDISFTGIRSFLLTNHVEIDNSKFNIEMEIRMLKDTGIILFMGKKKSSFVCLSLQNGLLELRVHSSKIRANIRDPITVRSSKLLLKGVWHKVQFGVFGRKVYLYVDHIINIGIMDHRFMLNMPNGSIYLGGLPDMSELPITAHSNHPVPFTGCLRYLSIDERTIPLTRENILDSRNVIDCDGTPCGGEACYNGGSCWLDSALTPHCSCVEPYYGKQCEFAPQCTEKTCKNGRCHNSTCFCHVGFEGGFCETEIEVRTPAFVGKSYLIVETLGDKKRNIRDTQIQKLYLNFTTAKNNGLLVWVEKDNNSFFGLGLEKGFIKIVYSLRKELIELVPYYRFSDGLWHNLELTFNPLLLKMDNRIINLWGKQTENKKGSLEPLSTNGIFYIGGLPNSTNLIKETKGMFPQSFDGCIEAFSTNTDKIIRDFTLFEGENIENCNIL